MSQHVHFVQTTPFFRCWHAADNFIIFHSRIACALSLAVFCRALWKYSTVKLTFYAQFASFAGCYETKRSTSSSFWSKKVWSSSRAAPIIKKHNTVRLGSKLRCLNLCKFGRLESGACATLSSKIGVRTVFKLWQNLDASSR